MWTIVQKIMVTYNLIRFFVKFCIKRVNYLYSLNEFAIIDIKLFVTELRSLRYEQRQMIVAINKLQETLNNVLATDTIQLKRTNESFERRYELQFPLSTYETFVEFDTKLSQDEECHTVFVSVNT